MSPLLGAKSVTQWFGLITAPGTLGVYQPLNWACLAEGPQIERLNRTERNSIYHLLLTFIETSIIWCSYRWPYIIRCYQMLSIRHQPPCTKINKWNNVNPLFILIIYTPIIFTSYITDVYIEIHAGHYLHIIILDGYQNNSFQMQEGLQHCPLLSLYLY